MLCVKKMRNIAFIAQGDNVKFVFVIFVLVCYLTTLSIATFVNFYDTRVNAYETSTD